MTIAYLSTYGYAGGVANDTRTNGMISSMELGGFAVVQASAKELNPSGRLKSLFAQVPVARTVVMGSGVKSWLERLRPLPDVVFVYGADPRFLRPARRWARSKGVPIIVEVVDWYEIRDGASLGQKAFTGLINLWSMPMEAARCDAAVVASSVLADYFNHRRVATVRVPAIMATDTSGVAERPEWSGTLRLAYAGTPGRRDLQTLRNIAGLRESTRLAGMRVEIDVIGVEASVPLDSSADSGVTLRYHGRVPREEALDLISRAHFTILQRDPARRFAAAGFPSKIAESLLLGTPVMSNLSSDLGEYLSDEVNAIVLTSDSYDALEDGVVRAVNWLNSAGPDRKKVAERAAEAFAPSSYARGLSSLVRSVGGERAA